MSVVVVVVQVLVGVAQLGTKQADGPRNLHPQHEQRQRREGAVDGVIAGQEYLRIDIDILQNLHGDTRQDARYDGAGRPDARVGHEDVEHHEECRHQHIGRQVYQELHGRAEH